MSKHYPGPWQYKPKPYLTTQEAMWPAVLQDNSGRYIGSMFIANDRDCGTANAALIEVAPELLENLKRAIRELTRLRIEVVEYEGPESVEDLDAIISDGVQTIAKAEGQPCSKP